MLRTRLKAYNGEQYNYRLQRRSLAGLQNDVTVVENMWRFGRDFKNEILCKRDLPRTGIA